MTKRGRVSRRITVTTILTAFLICIIGITFSFVTLLAKSEQNEQNATGLRCLCGESSSSSLLLEGNFIIGYNLGGNNSIIDAITFKLKIIIEDRLIDLNNNEIEIFIIVNSNNQEKLTESSTILDEDDEDKFVDTSIGTPKAEFQIIIIDDNGDNFLESGEIAKVYIQLSSGNGITKNEEVDIVLIIGVNLLKITKTMPSIIDMGENVII